MAGETAVIADDHQIIRDGIKDAIGRANERHALSLTVAAEADNGLDTLSAVKQHKPTLLFLDISMPLASGAEILTDVRRFSPDTRILVFTGVVAPGLLATMVNGGVQGVFSKTASTEVLVEQLPLLLKGGQYVDETLLEAIEQGQSVATLTERERQTLNMVLTGKTTKEIARLLNISPKTVDKHRTSFMQKLGVRSVAELMSRALKDGLIDPQ